MPYLTRAGAGSPRTGVRPGTGAPGHPHPPVAPTERSRLGRPGRPLDRVVPYGAGGSGTPRASPADGARERSAPPAGPAAPRAAPEAHGHPRRPGTGVRAAEPFGAVPGHWDDIVSRTGTGVSE
ncbi:MAG TPA: hypothetical protein VFP69_06750 [Streptomyces sp.]|nr:hypothetical protein [Streptomyces sp.]